MRQPPRRYDTVFFAFWLSHVPPTRLPDFWNTVASALAPGGKAVFIDDGPAVAASEEVLADQPAPAVLRRLDDGSRYRIVKVFHDREPRYPGSAAARRDRGRPDPPSSPRYATPRSRARMAA